MRPRLRPLARAATAVMEVEVTEPKLVAELVDALRRCGYRVLQTGPATLTVDLEQPPPALKAIPGVIGRELDLYLKVWEARHPGVRARRTR
jgi:hypothetical protein